MVTGGRARWFRPGSAGVGPRTPVSMTINGEYEIRAAPAAVWNCLLRPDVLKQAIPGCQEILERQDAVFDVRLVVAAGPVHGVFEGQISFEQSMPPEHCRLVAAFEGRAGAVEGWADVDLHDAAGFTQLRYGGQLQARGMLAALGDRMLQRLFRRSLDSFFDTIGQGPGIRG